MSILPKSFDNIVRFAAIEVYLRGVGPAREYDYSIQDVLIVALLLEAPIEKTVKDFQRCDARIKNLFYAYRACLERKAEEEAAHEA